MSNDLFEIRKLEFIETIKREKRLPKSWEFRFSDGEDMRVWFDKLPEIGKFKVYKAEVEKILSKYDKKVLTDKEREEEFLNCIYTIKRIPQKNEIYFSDNKDMYTWYITYKKKKQSYETIVYNKLPEYTELDLVTVWPLIKQEFIHILKTLKRIPEHGEVILQNDIDVRVVYEKLKSHDPEFFEKLMLHLKTYDKKGLTTDDRVNQFKKVVAYLGYIPLLQEARFTDGTDMFTWYMRYKDKLHFFMEDLNLLITKEQPKTKVNIYLIPNFRKTGGKFYTICTNVGEKLDLSNITSYEQAKELDDSLVKRGGLILKKDEEIDSVNFVKGKTKR